MSNLRYLTNSCNVLCSEVHIVVVRAKADMCFQGHWLKADMCILLNFTGEAKK